MSFNKHAVSIQRGSIVALNVPTCRIGAGVVVGLGPLTSREAFNLAAWLMTLVIADGHEFGLDAETALDNFKREVEEALNS